MNRTLAELVDDSLEVICKEHSEEGRSLLIQEGCAAEDIRVSLAADMCYRGQSNVIPVNFNAGRPASWNNVRLSFEETYRERYSRLLDGVDIVLVNVRVTVSANGAAANSIAKLIQLSDAPMPSPRSTRTFFAGAWRETTLFNRHELPKGATLEGPSILLQADTTTFIEPGYRASVHPTGNIIIEAM